MTTPTIAAAPRLRTAGSLRTILIAATALLSLLMVFAFGQVSMTAWQAYSRAQKVQAFDKAANQLIAGLFEVLMERLFANNALQAAGPIDDATKREIETRRKAVRENFEPGLAALKQMDFPNREALLADLTRALAKANDYRTQADRAVTQPRDSRDENLRKTFIPVITDSVNAALKVWFSALHAAAADDPTLAKLAVVKEVGWHMRDYSGKERSNIAQAIAAGAPIPAAALTFNAGTRAQVDILWQQLENLTAGADTAPEIKAAMAGARDRYFNAFRKLADDMKKAGDSEGSKYPVTSTQFVETTTPQIGALLDIMYAAGKASEAYTAKFAAGALQTLIIDLVLLLAGIAAAGASIVIVLHRVTGPLVALAGAMRRLADGDKSTAVPSLGRKDEIGQMADAVQVFKDNMIRAEQLETAQKAEQAVKEARAKAVESYIAEFDRGVATVLGLVASSSTQLGSTAKSMTATAEETSRQASAVAAASEQASSNVQTVASAAEELSSSIAEISRQVAESAKIAGQASEQANSTNVQIKGLAEAAQRIGDVVKLINDIASQTNLLALNATIEAARAGEAGKGFAVVASEVKSLANQTAKATEEISQKISEMQAATGQSVEAIGEITGTIGRINEIATTIASAVEEQGAATQEIARNVQQASAGTAQVSGNIGGVTKAATDTGAAASQVLGASGELARHSDTLRSQVDGFLQKIRAS